MRTERLEVRLPTEADRDRMIQLWCDPDFTVFSDGHHTPESASARFDRFLTVAAELPYAKQPVVERATGTVVGYAGIDWFDFEGRRELEFGWRLDTGARGKGYATEAATAVLEIARRESAGLVYCMIDPANAPSHNVARKLGFEPWRRVDMDGPVDLLRMDLVPRD
ncbi:MAG: GNAT family N-acetyltransferase [Actinomycetota bacterium]